MADWRFKITGGPGMWLWARAPKGVFEGCGEDQTNVLKSQKCLHFAGKTYIYVLLM